MVLLLFGQLLLFRFVMHNVYPYENRVLGMSEKEFTNTTRNLALITIANLKLEDAIQFPAGKLVVTALDDNSISFTLKGEKNVNLSLPQNEVDTHNITDSIESLLGDFNNVAPELAEILERDPSVYRRQNKEGWVINNKLCLFTGNIRYQPLRQTDTTAGPKLEVTVDTQAGEDGFQHGFDF
jgi:hypothetical protein